MMKEINLDQTLSSIVSQYPELIDLLYDFGFTQIKVPGMLQTAGRFITLRNGCELRKIDVNLLSIKLKQNGYEIKEAKD